jgi:hypothetical protein
LTKDSIADGRSDVQSLLARRPPGGNRSDARFAIGSVLAAAIMIALCCSRVVRSRLGISGRPPAPVEPTSRLGNWYVHLLRLGPRQYILATSERSLLSVVLPARMLRDALEENLRIAVRQLLMALDIPEQIVHTELAEMQSASIAPATNRRVLGSMNEFAFHFGVRQDQFIDLTGVAVSLSGIPMSAAGSKSLYGIPREVARELLLSNGKAN